MLLCTTSISRRRIGSVGRRKVIRRIDLFEVRRKVLVEQYMESVCEKSVIRRDVPDPLPIEGTE